MPFSTKREEKVFSEFDYRMGCAMGCVNGESAFNGLLDNMGFAHVRICMYKNSLTYRRLLVNHCSWMRTEHNMFEKNLKTYHMF